MKLWFTSVVCGALTGFLLFQLFGIMIFHAPKARPKARTIKSDERPPYYHEGWCSLSMDCKDKCHCHDSCGPVCKDWQIKLFRGEVEPYKDMERWLCPSSVVECIVFNSLPDKERMRIYERRGEVMDNENATVEQVLSRAESGDWNCSRCVDQCDCQNTENIIKVLASDIRVAHKREIDELKKQVSIAKDAFFKIAQRKHSREVHDIVCEAEFTMNHPECREAVTK